MLEGVAALENCALKAGLGGSTTCEKSSVPYSPLTAPSVSPVTPPPDRDSRQGKARLERLGPTVTSTDSGKTPEPLTLHALAVLPWSFADVVAEMAVEIRQVRETDLVANVGDGFIAAFQEEPCLSQAKFADQVAEVLTG